MQFLCGDFLLPCHDEDFEAIVAEIDADANMLVGGMVQFHSGVLQKYIQKLHKVPRHELSKWANSCEDYADWTRRMAHARQEQTMQNIQYFDLHQPKVHNPLQPFRGARCKVRRTKWYAKMTPEQRVQYIRTARERNKRLKQQRAQLQQQPQRSRLKRVHVLMAISRIDLEKHFDNQALGEAVNKRCRWRM